MAKRAKRRSYLRHLDFLQSNFPQNLCLEGARQRFHSKDHFQLLQEAVEKGDVTKLQKFLALAQSDPALCGSDLVRTAQKSLRQVLHTRKVVKMGLKCLKTIPWDYPAEEAARTKKTSKDVYLS